MLKEEESSENYYSEDSNPAQYSDSYSDSENYDDLTLSPLPKQIPGFFEVAYTQEYTRLMGLFFALYTKKEYSTRALKLCNKIIEKYCTHSQAWAYKIEIYKHIGFDKETVQNELEEQIVADTKIYGAWNAYQWLINETGIDPIPLLNRVFNKEPKNFHAWQFSIWYAMNFHKEEEIYKIALSEIEKDVYNNSAWNTRYSIAEMLKKPIDQEFDAAFDAMKKTPHNESVRNFLFGLCEKEPKLIDKLDALGKELCSEDKDKV